MKTMVTMVTVTVLKNVQTINYTKMTQQNVTWRIADVTHFHKL